MHESRTTKHAETDRIVPADYWQNSRIREAVDMREASTAQETETETETEDLENVRKLQGWLINSCDVSLPEVWLESLANVIETEKRIAREPLDPAGIRVAAKELDLWSDETLLEVIDVNEMTKRVVVAYLEAIYLLGQ